MARSTAILPTLRRAHRTPAVATRQRGGMAMLEFMFILPALMFFLLLIFDIGRVSLMSGVLHDAANQAARAGAQAGGGCINLATGGATGTCTEAAAGAVSVRSYVQSLEGKPAVYADRARIEVVSGGVCLSSPTSNHVVVNAFYEAPMITPGLNSLIGLAAGEPWRLTANAVSRCEIVRR